MGYTQTCPLPISGPPWTKIKLLLMVEKSKFQRRNGSDWMQAKAAEDTVVTVVLIDGHKGLFHPQGLQNQELFPPVHPPKLIPGEGNLGWIWG